MTPEEFDRQCRAEGKDYRLLEKRDNEYAHFQFTGIFEGNSLIWDAQLYTLAYYFNKVVEAGQSPREVRQFIDVGEAFGDMRHIRIALNLQAIDAPAISKTMIMIRQYKRLLRGRYEYGDSIRLE